jgi:hypothetical protein
VGKLSLGEYQNNFCGKICFFGGRLKVENRNNFLVNEDFDMGYRYFDSLLDLEIEFLLVFDFIGCCLGGILVEFFGNRLSFECDLIF